MEFGGNDFNLTEFEKDFFQDETEASEEFINFFDEVIFLIDCSPETFKKDQNEITGIKAALQGYASFLKSKIIASTNDKTALIFYGTVSSLKFLNSRTRQKIL